MCYTFCADLERGKIYDASLRVADVLSCDDGCPLDGVRFAVSVW